MMELEGLVEVGVGLFTNNIEPLLYNWFSSVTKRITFSESSTSDIEILHISDNFLVVNKPFDLVINSNDPNEKDTLQMRLRQQLPQLANENLPHDFYFVHRLDYATSGLICLALHKKACSLASISFQQRKTKKYYLAILRGHVSKSYLDINAPIGEDASEQSGNHRMCTSTDTNCILPREARTVLLVLERGEYDERRATKVLLRLITGRRHQLRVHCASIGHPIVGDYTYSNRVDVEPYRTFLHAYRLILPNSCESLDIATSDPFTPESEASDWRPMEPVNALDPTVFHKMTFEGEQEK